MPEDRTTIGLTESNKEFIKVIVDSKKITAYDSIARFAFSYGIMNKMENEAIKFDESTTTVWNIGTLDKDGVMLTTIRSLFPKIEQPKRFLEAMINVALNQIKKCYEESGNRFVITTLTKPII